MTRARVIALLALAAAGGCFNPSLGDSPFRCMSTDPQCPSGYHCAGGTCVAQTGGTPDAPALPDAGGPCPAGTRSCSGDVLIECDGNGAPVVTECRLGCDPSVVACFVMTPTNLATVCTVSGALPGSMVFNGDNNVNTGACALLGGTVVPQPGAAPELCAVRYLDVAITAGARLGVRGARPLVVVSLGRLVIAGELDVAGHARDDGAGVTRDSLLGRGGTAAANTSRGGGGGGHGLAGAEGGGGIATGSDVVLPGGPQIGNPMLSPLTPGGPGGTGGYPCALECPQRHNGGGGGGAVHLIACGELVIAPSAVIQAGGGGGGGGIAGAVGVIAGGGGGGGAGGGILIEAPVVTIPAGTRITANGGGGGGGGGGSAAADGQSGEDGPIADARAARGAGGDSSAGKGGEGGSSSAPDKGETGTTGGGGGGAPGRIRINGRRVDIDSNAVISPRPTMGNVGRGH